MNLHTGTLTLPATMIAELKAAKTYDQAKKVFDIWADNGICVGAEDRLKIWLAV